MSEKRYPPMVEKEFKRLIKTAEERAEIKTIKTISTVVNRWKKGSLTATAAVAEIRQITTVKETSWSQNADPGVPVAQALAEGNLTRSDLSDQAWSFIDFLVTLAEL